jgi:hypothetical protein
MHLDRIEAALRYCILYRLCGISRLPRKISLITGNDFSASKINVLWEEGSTRENERNNTRILTLISEDRLCFYSMAAGKKCGVQRKLLMGRVRLRVHTDTQQQAPSYSTSSLHAVSGSWCFCALEKSRILHTAIALAAPIVKTFLLKNLGNCSGSSQSCTREEHAQWRRCAQSRRCAQRSSAPNNFTS